MRRTEIIICSVVAGVAGLSWCASELRWARINSPVGKFSTLVEYLALDRLPVKVTTLKASIEDLRRGVSNVENSATGRFTSAEVEGLWDELWKSGGPAIGKPKIESLSENDVRTRMVGKWSVMFGVIPDELEIEIRTNRLVKVSGNKDGETWMKSGEWQVVSDKLVLNLKGEDIPSFIFSSGNRVFIFDPWAKAMRSEMKHAD